MPFGLSFKVMVANAAVQKNSFNVKNGFSLTFASFHLSLLKSAFIKFLQRAKLNTVPNARRSTDDTSPLLQMIILYRSDNARAVSWGIQLLYIVLRQMLYFLSLAGRDLHL